MRRRCGGTEVAVLGFAGREKQSCMQAQAGRWGGMRAEF